MTSVAGGGLGPSIGFGCCCCCRGSERTETAAIAVVAAVGVGTTSLQTASRIFEEISSGARATVEPEGGTSLYPSNSQEKIRYVIFTLNLNLNMRKHNYK